MNKADLERALKKLQGKALKKVIIIDEEGFKYEVVGVEWDEELNAVVIRYI